MLTTTQAAAELGITTGRMRVLIRTGRVAGEITPAGYKIHRADLKAVAVRTPGRPRKSSAQPADRCLQPTREPRQ